MQISYISNLNSYLGQKHTIDSNFKGRHKIELSVDDVKDQIRQGCRRKELASAFGVSEGTITRFLKEHDDEIDYVTLKQQAIKDIVEKSENVGEVQEKLNISYARARDMVRRYSSPENRAVNKKRQQRLKQILPLYQSGFLFGDIVKKLGINASTVRSDIAYFNASDNEYKIKKHSELERDKRLEKIIPLLKSGLCVERVAKMTGSTSHTVKADVKYYNSQNADDIVVISTDLKRATRIKTVLQLFSQGMSIEEVSEKTGYSIDKIMNDIKYYNKHKNIDLQSEQ